MQEQLTFLAPLGALRGAAGGGFAAGSLAFTPCVQLRDDDATLGEGAGKGASNCAHEPPPGLLVSLAACSCSSSGDGALQVQPKQSDLSACAAVAAALSGRGSK